MTIRPANREEIGTALLETGLGSRTAFQRLYELTSAALFRVCLRVCGDRQVAEDILHDVYLSIWKRAHSFDPTRGEALGWMVAISRNRCIDWHRRQFKKPAELVGVALELVDPRPLANEQLIVDDLNKRMLEQIAALEEHQRYAIQSAFFGGATYAEIANHLGVPLSTIKSRIRRGLTVVRIALEAESEISDHLLK